MCEQKAAGLKEEDEHEEEEEEELGHAETYAEYMPMKCKNISRLSFLFFSSKEVLQLEMVKHCIQCFFSWFRIILNDLPYFSMFVQNNSLTNRDKKWAKISRLCDIHISLNPLIF